MELLENFFSKYSQELLIKRFRQICVAEAISWLILFTAMIWIRVEPENIFAIIYISVIGSLHGLFFTLYLLLLPSMRTIFKWDDEDTVFSLLAAFFPFATIWIDLKLARFDRE